MKKIDNNFFLSSILFIFGVYIAYTRGSNFSDGDSYSVINAFLSLINEKTYSPSRGAYGHPIPEILIGFIAYNFGTKISNIFCFILFFLSIIFFYKTFLKKNINLNLFIILIFSNSFLFLENTNSIDYPIALFFLSLGFYFLKNQKYLLSYIFFGLTIACRVNFLFFVYPPLIIYFFNEIKDKKIKNFIISSLIVTIVGLIFYYPLFNLHNFTLDFLELPFIKEGDNSAGWYGGPILEFDSLLPRFIYKTYLITGIFSIFLFLLFFKDLIKKIQFKDNDNIILIFIIFINLFIFWFMPSKTLFINPFIIVSYIFVFKYLDTKKIYFLIIFNFVQWFVFYDIAEIKYKEKNICFAKEAISYNFKLSFKKGLITSHLTNNEDMTDCYSQFMGVYSENFRKGRALKLSK
jgi:hypothetical protein